MSTRTKNLRIGALLGALALVSASQAYTPGDQNRPTYIVGWGGPGAQKIADTTNPLPVTSVQSGFGTSSPGTITCSTTTRPADTTAYASGDLIANSTTAGSVTAGTCTIAAGVYDLLDAGLLASSTVLTNASFRIHLYTSNPASFSNGDNGAWLTPNAGYACAFDVTVDRAFTDGSWGRGLALTGTPCRITSAGTVYYVLEARGAYTPTSGETFIPKLTL